MKSVEKIEEELAKILYEWPRDADNGWVVKKFLSIKVGGEVVAEKDEDCVITETRPRTIRDLLEVKK